MEDDESRRKKKAAGSSSSAGSGAGAVLLLLVFILGGSLLTDSHPLDVVFYTIAFSIFYCFVLLLVGGLGFLFGYFILVAFGDLFEAFKLEFAKEDREHLEAIVKDAKNEVIKALSNLWPVSLLIAKMKAKKERERLEEERLREQSEEDFFKDMF